MTIIKGRMKKRQAKFQNTMVRKITGTIWIPAGTISTTFQKLTIGPFYPDKTYDICDFNLCKRWIPDVFSDYY